MARTESSAVLRGMLCTAPLGLGLIAPTEAPGTSEYRWRHNVQWGRVGDFQ